MHMMISNQKKALQYMTLSEAEMASEHQGVKTLYQTKALTSVRTAGQSRCTILGWSTMISVYSAIQFDDVVATVYKEEHVE